MDLVAISRSNFGEIEGILSRYAPGLTRNALTRGISEIQGPILEYVSTHVPDHYDPSFEYMDTWEFMMRDIVDRVGPMVVRKPTSSVKFEASNIVSPVKKFVGSLPITESLPSYMGPVLYVGAKPIGFQKKVAFILVIMLLIQLALSSSESVAPILTEFAASEKKTFTEKVISNYIENRDKKEEEDK